ncbi:hypothetical protein ACLOJK_020828 [Asimina triloba]
MADHHQNKPVTGYPAAQSSYPPPNTATAYPYPAPPPPPPGAYYHPNPYPPPPPPYDPRRAVLLRRLVAVVIAVLIIIGAITFIVWLVLRPHLPRFSVVAATLSNFNLSSSHLTADWNISISARNPNSKMGVYYDRVEASIFYGREMLSSTSLDPFYQGKHNVTTIDAEFASVSEYVDGDVSRGLTDDQSRHGFVKFHVRLIARVRFRAGAWRTRQHIMRVFCDDVSLGFSSGNGTSTLLGRSKDCEVDL